LITSFHERQGRIFILDSSNPLQTGLMSYTKTIYSEQHCEISEDEHISQHINEKESWQMVTYKEKGYLWNL
jgi:hypothetical protein